MEHRGRGRTDEAECAQMARRHVLVLDGEPAVLDLVEALLREEHYNVTCSNYLPSTLSMIDVLQPDLIVVDLAWGQQAGWDVLEALGKRASTAGVPVLVTATDRRLLAEVAADPARFGTHRDLIKPFIVTDLLAAVRDLAGAA